MSDLSNYAEDKVYKAIFKATNLTAPAQLYLALVTVITDAEAGTFTEVTGGSYARQACSFTANTDGAGTLSADITFPTATADWGTVVGGVLMDASTGGNPWSKVKAFTGGSKVVANGDVMLVPAANLTVSIA